jgi:hypothetical protein
MVLANHILQGLWSQALGERRGVPAPVRFAAARIGQGFKQIIHCAILREAATGSARKAERSILSKPDIRAHWPAIPEIMAGDTVVPGIAQWANCPHHRNMPESDDANQRLHAFLARYEPAIAEQAHAVRARLQQCFPSGFELIYDNYNALVVGYGPSVRASDAVLSIAVYPRWVTLFFLDGVRLDDPGGLLSGSGKRVRNLRLDSADDLDLPAVRKLIEEAMAPAQSAFGLAGPMQTVIKSVSVRQRPRRPSLP